MRSLTLLARHTCATAQQIWHSSATVPQLHVISRNGLTIGSFKFQPLCAETVSDSVDAVESAARDGSAEGLSHVLISKTPSLRGYKNASTTTLQVRYRVRSDSLGFHLQPASTQFNKSLLCTDLYTVCQVISSTADMHTPAHTAVTIALHT